MNILLDLNVVLDAILQRRPWVTEAAAVWGAHHSGKVRAHLIATSLTNLFYIARKLIGRDDARRAVQTCLQTFPILAVDGPLLVQADALLGTDFEDNVQLAAAVAYRLDAIVTRNPADFSGSPLPILTPAELLARLAPPSPPSPSP